MRNVAPMLLFLFGTCGIVSCNEDKDDGGFLPEELAQTASRLSARKNPGDAKAHTTSFLAIPTAAYTNAYADMRSPPAASMPNPFSSGGAGVSGMPKLSFPGFALKQEFVSAHGPSSQPAAAHEGTKADLRTSPYKATVGDIKLGIPQALLRASQASHESSSSSSTTTELMASGTGGDSVMRALVGNRKAAKLSREWSQGARAGDGDGGSGGDGGGSVGLSERATASLSLYTGSDAKAAAMDRLSGKHANANRITRTITDPLTGPRSDEIAVHPAKHGLDSSVKQYHGYLATAVMILASLAGTAICGGICAVTYCYAKRERNLSDLDADGGRGEKQFYGRPTAQYGSDGRRR